ncbi:hypothetical protein EVAR_91499_1 [Eumeta japonica]|uniref:Uncharacterized protein n=1 Tax=Eumeta variegata TaxID=151549 RepID=A0A4C1VA57_EUMVA|nr:hypothetical protein EVAR_91499_1 [Eumeta japonica]
MDTTIELSPNGVIKKSQSACPRGVRVNFEIDSVRGAWPLKGKDRFDTTRGLLCCTAVCFVALPRSAARRSVMGRRARRAGVLRGDVTRAAAGRRCACATIFCATRNKSYSVYF